VRKHFLLAAQLAWQGYGTYGGNIGPVDANANLNSNAPNVHCESSQVANLRARKTLETLRDIHILINGVLGNWKSGYSHRRGCQ
jgi:hypothetical protein